VVEALPNWLSAVQVFGVVVEKEVERMLLAKVRPLPTVSDCTAPLTLVERMTEGVLTMSPLVALRFPPIVVEPVERMFAMVANPLAVNVWSVAPPVALNCPPIVVEPRAKTFPVLEMVKRVEVANAEVEDAMEKRVTEEVPTVDEAAKSERSAVGEEVPRPTLPFARNVVVALPPK
jgi:hypothetical protein